MVGRAAAREDDISRRQPRPAEAAMTVEALPEVGPRGAAGHVDLSRRLYPLAFRVLRENAAPAALLLSVLMLLNIVQGVAGPSVGLAPLRLGCLVLMAHAAYRVLLTSGAVQGMAALSDPNGRAPLRFIGVMVLIFLPMILIGAIWTTPGGPQMLGGFFFVGAILLMVLAYGALLVLMGTALPELAERGHADPAAALRRGLAGYRSIARGLVLGPGLFGVANGLVLVIAGYLGLPDGAYNPATGTFSPGALAVLTLLSLGNLYSVTLAAVVLSRAYRAEVPAPGR